MTDIENPCNQTTMRHPDCSTPSDCRIEAFGGTTTLMAWTPVFDGDGRSLNHDPNTSREHFACQTCKRKWVRRTKNGDVSYE